MIKYIIVDGTHGEYRKDDFSAPGSGFRGLLASLDLVAVMPPFEWSTALDGLWGPHVNWHVGGVNLYCYAVPPLCPEKRVPPEDLLVIAFSHGAQVAFYAFAEGLKGSLITVNPPVRQDMENVVAMARPNISRWLNLYGDWKDVWAVLGAARDGHFGIRRQFPQADKNVLVKGEHGAALRDEKYASEWPAWVREVI